MLRIMIQHLLPHHFISMLVGRFAKCRIRFIKHWQINKLIRDHFVNTEEIVSRNPDDYLHFNAFFTRSLRPGARPIAASSIVCPVDGKIMASGKINKDILIQAKGLLYSLDGLLSHHRADTFINGDFITFYLAPRDYHHIHSPVEGHLSDTLFVPGSLFSVNPYVVKRVSRLFARNERLICYIDTPQGTVAVIFIASMLVGSIHTAWQGILKGKRTLSHHAIPLKRGEDMGHFEFGSTVILLFPQGMLATPLPTNGDVRMGEALANTK